MDIRTVPICPECGGPVVFDGGLWHCDEGRDGAFDRESLNWKDNDERETQ